MSDHGTAFARTKNGHMAHARHPRAGLAALPASPAPGPRPGDDVRKALRMRELERRALAARLVQRLDAEVPLLDRKKRRAIQHRVGRATRELGTMPEGRLLLSRISERLSSPICRTQLQELAAEVGRDVAVGHPPDPEKVIGLMLTSLEVAEQAAEDIGAEDATSLDWCLMYGTWMARYAQASGRAAALKPDVTRVVIRTKKGGGEAYSHASSPWRDLVAVEATAASRAEYAFEMARRASAAFRVAQRERDAAQNRDAMLARFEAVVRSASGSGSDVADAGDPDEERYR